MKNQWNRSVMGWMACLGALTMAGCPLDSETVGNEQEGGASGESSSTGDDPSASTESGTAESGTAESSTAESGTAESESSESAETSIDTTDGDPLFACADAEPILQFDGVTPSGFERCADGFVHRAEAVTCVLPEPPATCMTDKGAGADSCSSAADCTDAPNGTCIDDPSVLEGCGCVYACETDADCAGGEICACTGATGDVPRCVPAGCEDSSGCGEGLCGLGITEFHCSNVEYEVACLDAQSECRIECEPEPACDAGGDLEVPPCEIVSGQWTCDENADLLCGDCG